MTESRDREATPPRSGAGEPADRSLVRLGVGLARLSALAWWRAAGWSFGMARQALGVADARAREATSRQVARGDSGRSDGARSGSSLRERGAELLRRSADVRIADDTHPAYERILGDLAPDEGRILRLLASEGPQPAVDIRTARPLNIGSKLVAPGLSMIAEHAGCRHRDRTHAYLNNLYRLGLIWFSRERLEDPRRYQVLEAQPDVVGAMRQAGRATTMRRSIHLTPFGEDFCRLCLPLDGSRGSEVGEPG
jgi:abortive infection alpha-like protein